jgi:hypothetical protein
MADLTNREKLIPVYKELCQTYRSLDDFRAKLLGFLPLASAGGIFLLVSNSENIGLFIKFSEPLGIFGFFITLGLLCYELYAIKKCHSLIKVGRELELLLSIKGGQFSNRPRSLLGVINEVLAAGVIYSAVLAGWTFLLNLESIQSTDINSALIDAGCIFLIFLLGIVAYNIYLPIKYPIRIRKYDYSDYKKTIGKNIIWLLIIIYVGLTIIESIFWYQFLNDRIKTELFIIISFIFSIIPILISIIILDLKNPLLLEEKILLNLEEAQYLTGLSREILREAINSGKLKAQIIGKSWRVKRFDLSDYIDSL